MKKLITLLCSTAFVLVSLSGIAQEIQKGNPGMWPSFIKYTGAAPVFNRSSVTITDTGGQKSNVTNGRIQHYEKDQKGMEHYRYQQFMNGIAIEHAAMVVHVLNGRIITQNGKWIKDFPASLPARPSLSEAAALRQALDAVNAEAYKWESPAEEAFLKREQNDPNASFYPKGELVYYSGEKEVVPSALRLTYKFDVYAQTPLSRQIIFVDAVNGNVLGKREMIHETNAPGTAQTVYSGTQTITADYTGSNYRLRETGRGAGINTYNLQTGTNYGAAVDFTDADNNWNNVNAAKDQYATDAHWATEKTYDYYYQRYGRNSIDNAGFALNSYVHYSNNYFNAFWDGNRMTYGDGDAAHGSKPLTALDVCGHEITHGVTGYTSNLVYSYESGAMNEAFSDIFGTAIEAFSRPGNYDWLIGGDFFAIRSMSNPNAYADPDTYLGTYWYSGSGDNGGVHTNSGVLNYWFYLLSAGGSGVNDHGTSFNVTAIGINKAAAIAYRLNTYYLISTSNYFDARTLGIQAAVDLYGPGSPEATQTAAAFTAVGLYGTTCSPVTGLNASPVLDVSATLNWTASPGALYYDVEYKLSTSSTWISLPTPTGTSISINGLTPATLYDWRVRSSCNTNFVNAQFTTATPACNAPGGLNATPNNTSAILGWSAVPYGVSYDVEYKIATDNFWTAAGNTTSPAYNLTGLLTSTTYDWRVKTNCNFGSSGFAQGQFTTNAQPCDQPTGLAFSYSDNISTFTWNAASGAIGYEIEIDWAGGNWGGAYGASTTTNSFSLANLMQGGNFQFRVRTQCSFGYSIYSATLFFTTPCSTPGGLTTTNITTTSATLNWVPAIGNNGNTAFEVTYRLANTNNTWISLGTTTGSTMNISGLTPGTAYEWRVRKLCSALNSSYVVAQFTTVVLPVCNAPSGLSSSAITGTQATVSWAAVSGAVGYSVQYKAASSNTWSAPANTNSTSTIITGLVASTLYDWRVSTNCSGNTSGYVQAQFTTSTSNGCAVPTGLYATSVGNTTAVAGWNAVSGASSYRMQYKTVAASGWTTVSNISGTSQLLSGLQMNTEYQFKVSTKCGSTYSAYSTVSSFTTLNCVSNGINSSEWIDLFAIGTINRTSGAEAGGYINTGLSTNLVIGSSGNPGQISAGFPGSIVQQKFAVYIDFNRDGIFEDSGERVAGISTISNAGVVNFSIKIPGSATPGPAGMRVVMRNKNDGSVAPCITGFLGETEDYTVNLVASGPWSGFSGDPVTKADMPGTRITVSPNPSGGLFTIDLPNDIAPAYYEVVNISGTVVKKQSLKGEKIFKIDLTSLPNGLYLLRMFDQSGRQQICKLLKD